MKKNKMSPNKADRTCSKTRAAVKTGLAIIGVGVVAGTTLVIGLDHIMKKIFVNEDWPAEEWSNDDWAEEELDA
ncbi:MAG: hypothetical protein SPI74_01490 [Eubacterium sp.]|nr:hypothetical protein [Eubacterium sp.]